jgi:elongation factor 1-gamma
LEFDFPVVEPPKTTQSPSYLAKFPLGKVPALELYPSADHPNGFYLTEVNAIVSYLCSISSTPARWLGRTTEEKAKVQQWMWFAHEHLHIGTLSPLINMKFGFQAYVVKREAEKDKNLSRWFAYLDEHLKSHKWLVDVTSENGGKVLDLPSLADVNLAAVLRLGFMKVVEEKERAKWPSLMAWWERVVSIPEVKDNFKLPERLCESRDMPEAKK